MKTIKIAAFALSLSLTLFAFSSFVSAAGWGWDRDAGARVRGEYGVTPRTQTSSRSYVAATPSPATTAAAEDNSYAYRSFSYQPTTVATFKAGDVIAIVTPRASIQLGSQVLTSVDKGQRLTVLEARGPWLGVQASGKAGWLQASHATPAK